MTKLKSLTIFFPFYNDEGTVAQQINDAYFYGSRVATRLKVVALHGGRSHDRTLAKIRKMQKIYPRLQLINKISNQEGYAVIKYGLTGLRTEWVFYTDGDAQYRLVDDLEKAVRAQLASGADVVNGYKIRRQDNVVRIILGKAYAILCRIAFQLPIRDVDCDFRLIRTSILKKVRLESHDSLILPELIKKLHLAGASFKEVPVYHYPRVYGKSNYNILSLVRVKIISGFRLYQRFRIKGKASGR